MAETKRGRPPLDPDDPTVRISVSLPSKTYDRLWTEARGAAVSVPAHIRQELNKRSKKATNA